MSTITIIDFWAPHCGACRQMTPVFDRLSEQYPWVEFQKVNTNDDPDDIASRHGVQGLPTFVVLADGVAQDRCGAMPPAAFERWLKAAIEEAAS